MTDWSTIPRQAGKRGARKSERRPERFLDQYRTTGPTSRPPATGDVSHGITSWGMDGNADVGDCVEAATDHYVVAITGDVNQIGKLGGVGPQVMYCQFGLAQGEQPAPGTSCPDEGSDPRAWLDFAVAHGAIDEWAELNNPNDVDEVHQAMLDFSGVLITVDLTDDAEQLFNSHQPWTVAGGESSDPNDGHGILLVKYDDLYDTFVTWGALQQATVDWDAACITGAFVILSNDDPLVDVAALKARIAALGENGNAPVVAPPTPAPAPPVVVPPKPAPTPPAGLRKWLVDFLDWLEGVEDEEVRA